MNIALSWKELDKKKKSRKMERVFQNVQVQNEKEAKGWAKKQADVMGIKDYKISFEEINNDEE